MPLDNVNFEYTRHNETPATCRYCGKKATHLSPTGTYMDAYPVCEDGTYNEKTNTYICNKCWNSGKR